MFIFKRGNSLKNVQLSTKKKPKNLGVLKTVEKKPVVRKQKQIVEQEETTAKKNTKKVEKNKE